MDNLFWFKSSELKIIKGEDEETNPMRYGKSVANWISESLNEKGYESDVWAEDWGWRVDCKSEPCPIWIGCGNVDDMDSKGNILEPNEENIIWHCFVEADVPFFKKLFGKIDAEPAKREVAKVLTELLDSTQHVTEVEEP